MTDWTWRDAFGNEGPAQVEITFCPPIHVIGRTSDGITVVRTDPTQPQDPSQLSVEAVYTADGQILEFVVYRYELSEGSIAKIMERLEPGGPYRRWVTDEIAKETKPMPKCDWQVEGF